MVAPLVMLLATEHRIDPAASLLEPLAAALRWPLAFDGPQPHVRLHGIAIRHRDGFWFGVQRQWGDMFPHRWSCLTAVALAQLPSEMTDHHVTEQAEAIMSANLTNITPTAAQPAPSSCPRP